VGKDATIGRTLSVGKAVTVGGAMTVTSTMTASAMALSIVTGTLSVANAATLSDTLTVTNAATFDDTVDIGGALTAQSTLTVDTDATVGSSLTVGKAVTASSTLNVAGAATLGLTLSVATAASFNTLDVAKTVALGPAAAAILSSTLSVVNAATLAGDLILQGSLSIDGTLDVGAFVSSPTFAPTLSDRRLKANVVPIRDSLAKVKALRGVYFHWAAPWQDGVQFDNRRHIGFMAQDVRNAVPEAVNTVGDGKYLGVDYASLIAVLLEALRELDQRIQVVDAKRSNIGSRLRDLLVRNGNNESATFE
jgi:hypothetical protein